MIRHPPCKLNRLRASTTAESRANIFGTSKMHLRLQKALAAVHFKAVVVLLLIRC